jgi:hypothetical protein
MFEVILVISLLHNLLPLRQCQGLEGNTKCLLLVISLFLEAKIPGARNVQGLLATMQR